MYHVHKHDLAGLESAIKAAKENPIEYFIPDHMRFDAVCEYTADALARDWKEEAREVLMERKREGGEVSYSPLLLSVWLMTAFRFVMECGV